MSTFVNLLLKKRTQDFDDARLVSLRSGRQGITDDLSAQNQSHLYKFRLQKRSSFRAILKTRSHPVGLTLFDESGTRLHKFQTPHAGTSNAQTDNARTRNTRSNNARTGKLRTSLDNGIYYVRVNRKRQSTETTYRLRLKTQDRISPPNSISKEPIDSRDSGSRLLDLAGNSQQTARVLGVIKEPFTQSDWVGKKDTIDYYSVSLSDRSRLVLNLKHLSADADLALMDRSGTILKRGIKPNTKNESISYILNSGTYFVRVTRYAGKTSYNLTLSANDNVPNEFNPDVGYGLVNGAAAVAKSIGEFQFDSVSSESPSWGIETVNAPAVWANGFTGKGITVAVIDTGVDVNHVDLINNIWVNADEIPGNGIDDDGNGFIDDRRGWDFIGNDNSPFDLNGHGTHVAGTIAAERNQYGVTGVAPDAKLMPVRVLDKKGVGRPSDISAGIHYAVDNGANVINLSLGADFSNSAIQSAIQYAFQQGVVVVMAAGNESQNSPLFPASIANRWGIAVGASDINNNLAIFSNEAGRTTLDYVVAPGVSIQSTLPGNNYGFQSGTSMAAPHVAGIAALIVEADSTLSPRKVERHIVNTAEAIA